MTIVFPAAAFHLRQLSPDVKDGAESVQDEAKYVKDGATVASAKAVTAPAIDISDETT